MDKVDISLPLCTIMQVGLVDLLRTFGVTPVAVVGHSNGEVAAAYCAGALSQESAFKLAYYKGIVTAKISEDDSMKGAMMAVGLSSEAVIPYFDLLRPEFPAFNLVVSCINSPINITVSGEEPQIEALGRILTGNAIFARRLRVNAAYHSPQMDKAATECISFIGTLKVHDPTSTVMMVSTVTGSTISKEDLCRPYYWYKNMVSPVLFSQAVERLCLQSKKSLTRKLDGSHRDAIVVDTLIELGAHGALQLPLREIISTLPRQSEISCNSVLYRKRPAFTTLLSLIGLLYCAGFPINLRRINDHDAGSGDSLSRISMVDVPEYTFNHTRTYWHESSLSRRYRLRSHGHVELLGTQTRDWTPLSPQWRCCVIPSEMPWLKDHKIDGKIIYPAAAMIVMAVQAASQMADRARSVTGFTLRRVQFLAAIAVPFELTSNSEDLETRFRMQPVKSESSSRQSAWQFTMFSVVADSWIENCNGIIQIHYQEQEEDIEALERLLPDQKAWVQETEGFAHTVDSTRLYRAWRKEGFHYGSSFQGIIGARYNEGSKATSSIDLSKPLEFGSDTQDFVVHPASLDAIFQVALVASSKGGTLEVPTQVVTAVDYIWISNEGLKAANDYVDAFATYDTLSPRTRICSTFVMSNDRRHERIVLDGLEISTIATSLTSFKANSGESQLWYHINSAIDIDMLGQDATIRWLDNVCGLDTNGPVSLNSDLDAYILLSLRAVQHEVKSTGLVPTQPHLRKYLQWIDWQLERMKSVELPREPHQTLLNRIEDKAYSSRFFKLIALNALGVLKGEVDVIQLFTEKNLVKAFYGQHALDSVYLLKLEKYVQALAFKYPAMKILEVGAGSGTFTKHLLKALSRDNSEGAERCKDYLYTDASSALLEKARDEFSTYANKISFKVLEIEKDPLAQGYQEASFDVIATSNVLHATKDLDTTLQAIRKLLKPGGKLILHETTVSDSLQIGFAFGLLPKWWHSSEEYRRMSPIVSEATWDTLLTTNGFSGVDFVLRDYADKSSRLMSVICTTAAESYIKQEQSTDLTIAVEEDSAFQMTLARQLEALLSNKDYSSIRIMSLEDTYRTEHAPSLLVTLFDIESPFLSRLAEGDFAKLKTVMTTARQTLWVTRVVNTNVDPGFGMIDGFAKVLRIEHIELSISTIALESIHAPHEDHAEKIVRVLEQFQHSPICEDYVVVDGSLHISRISQDFDLSSTMSISLSGTEKVIQSVEEACPFMINIRSPGQLDTLEVIKESNPLDILSHDEVEVEVHAVCLNEADSMVALGTTSSINLGNECAGIVKAVGNSCTLRPGDRVCLYGSGVFRSAIRTKEKHVARIPETVSFIQASTLPRDYLFASYLVYHVIRPCGRDMLLLHNGPSALTKAVIGLSLGHCSKIFVVAQDKEDEEILRGLYDTDDIHILSSVSYRNQLRHKEPRGADVVLNFFSECSLLDLLECVAPFGQVVHVEAASKASSKGRITLDLPSNVSFKTIDMVTSLQDRLDRIETPLQSLLDKVFLLKYSTRHERPDVFNLSEMEKAFASLRDAGAKHKVVVEMNKDDKISVSDDTN